MPFTLLPGVTALPTQLINTDFEIFVSVCFNTRYFKKINIRSVLLHVALSLQTQKELERAKQGSTGVSESLEQTNILLNEKEAELNRLKSLQKKIQDQYRVIT